jgi:hypothetical protein
MSEMALRAPLLTFEALLAAHPWRPIRGCPGRFTLASTLTPAAMLGLEPAEPLAEHRVEAAADPVIVASVVGGGLISYRRGAGWFVHTLNTPEGFARKLERLGLTAPK